MKRSSSGPIPGRRGSNESRSRIRQPVPDGNVHIVGEAYSGAQGWVEGALTMTEKALKDDLHIPQPEWLENIYLGW